MALINSIHEFREEILRVHSLIEKDGVIRDAKIHEGYKRKFLEYYKLYDGKINGIYEIKCEEIINAIDKHLKFVKTE